MGVRQGPGGRTHRLGQMGQRARVERLRLGQLPSGLRKVTRLAGIDDRDGQPYRRQRRHHGPLVASRGVKHHQGGLHSLESLHQDGNTEVIVGHGPAFAGGPQGDIELGFGDIDPNKTLWGRPHHSSLARPCQIRAAWLRATVRALEGVDVTTQAPLRSRWTKAKSVYHVQVTGDGDALHITASKDTRLSGVACTAFVRPLCRCAAVQWKGPAQRSRIASAPTPGAESAFKTPILSPFAFA